MRNLRIGFIVLLCALWAGAVWAERDDRAHRDRDDWAHRDRDDKGDFAPVPRFTDNGNGTITDNQTGLMWEKKTECAGPSAADIHCVHNRYFWSSTVPNPDGTLFTDFLARNNKVFSTSIDGSTVADVRFAGHCDWRIPNIAELRTIVDCSRTPCIDPIFGPTQAAHYWSSTTFANLPDGAWHGNFVNDALGGAPKDSDDYARAVRGGW